MNKIFLEGISDVKDIYLDKDTIITLKDATSKINLYPKEDINILMIIITSNINLNYFVNNNLNINIFSIDSTIEENIDITEDNIVLNYAYSTININNNSYNININHIGKNITSTVTNNGVNKTNNNLFFTINTIVPKESKDIKTSQNSKIITNNKEIVYIKPNLLIDTDDIEANHSAYIGNFKAEELFYLESRGINKKDAEDLLVKSFLIGNMKLSYKGKEIVLENIKKYWR